MCVLFCLFGFVASSLHFEVTCISEVLDTSPVCQLWNYFMVSEKCVMELPARLPHLYFYCLWSKWLSPSQKKLCGIFLLVPAFKMFFAMFLEKKKKTKKPTTHQSYLLQALNCLWSSPLFPSKHIKNHVLEYVCYEI